MGSAPQSGRVDAPIRSPAVTTRANETSGSGWYQLDRIDVSSLGTGARLDELHQQLADLYAAAHRCDEAREHFLTRRSPTDFDVIHVARTPERLLAWFGSSAAVIADRAVTTFDDAVVDPAFHRRGLTRALTLQAFRPIAISALRRRQVIALLTTNPIVAVAVEGHLRRSAARFPGIAAGTSGDGALDTLASAVAGRLHPEAPFDATTGVLRDFLPTWHHSDERCRDALVQDYFDRHVPAGSALLMLVPVDRAMVAAHSIEWAAKSLQTWGERRGARDAESAR